MTALLLCLASGAQAQVVFEETFGDSTVRTTSPYVPQQYVPTTVIDDSTVTFSHGGSHYLFADPNVRECPGGPTWNSCWWNSQTIDNGYYAVVNPANVYDEVIGLPDYPDWANWWNTSDPNHAGRGAVLVVNAGMVRNEFYHREVAMEPASTYRISAWQHVSRDSTAFRFEVQDGNPTVTGDIKVLTNSGNFQRFSPGTWQQFSYEFTVPAGCAATAPFTVGLRNMNANNIGNDFYIDDIVLEKVAYNPGAPTWSASDCPEPDDDEADLSITKDNAGTALVVGEQTTYTITVANAGPAAADGAVVRDAPIEGLDCLSAPAALTCSATGSAACPSPLTLSDFVDSTDGTDGTGLVIPTLPAGGGVVFELTCTVVDTP